MNKNLKTALDAAFAAPAPAEKQAFLRKLPPRPVSHAAFMLSQAGYIRKSTWALSAVILVLALAVGRYAPDDALWVIAALTPLAALTAVTENARSSLYGMEELELATRFSLKSVVLARMGGLGLVHLFLLCLLSPLARVGAAAGLLPAGVYLLTPYLLTTLLGLAVVRRIRGREAVYVCGALALLVSGLNTVQSSFSRLYEPEYFPWWLAALALCAALTAWEYHKTIQKSEELSWSL